MPTDLRRGRIMGFFLRIYDVAVAKREARRFGFAAVVLALAGCRTAAPPPAVEPAAPGPVTPPARDTVIATPLPPPVTRPNPVPPPVQSEPPRGLPGIKP